MSQRAHIPLSLQKPHPLPKRVTTTGEASYPADDALPVGASVSGFELVQHALEVVDPEAVVARQDVARQVALEAVPVVALRLPLLQEGGETAHSKSDDPPRQPQQESSRKSSRYRRKCTNPTHRGAAVHWLVTRKQLSYSVLQCPPRTIAAPLLVIFAA